MTTMTDVPGRMPVLFIGHGTPLNVISDNQFTRSWTSIGASIRPKLILSISGHWFTRGTRVTAMERPRTIHDFGYRNLGHLSYPAPGSPALAQRVANLLRPAPVESDHEWGLDHGTWSVLLKAYPAADIPVVQLSIDGFQPPHVHFEFGRRLAPLRDEGVLIVGTGNIVHNLHYSVRSGPEIPYPWAERFDAIIRDRLLARDWPSLINYRRLTPDSDLAVPTPDHYLPLLYAAGAANDTDLVSFPIEGIARGSMSMRSVAFGSL